MVGKTFTFSKLLPSNEKVCQVHFHPVLDWLASYDRNDYLTVWDWGKAEAILECQLGASGAGIGRQEAEFVARAEADGNFFGRELTPYVTSTYLTGQSYGRVRSCQFFDLDTIYWDARCQAEVKSGSAAVEPSVQHLGSLADRRFLLIVCDKAILLYDLLSKRVKTIPAAHPQLNGKPFLEATVLLRDERGAILNAPHIALACADGLIAVFEVHGDNVARVLRTGTGKEVPVCCMAVAPQFTGAGDMLLVGDEKGSVTVYKPTCLEAHSPTVLKGHSDAILNILYIPGPEGGGPAPILVTVGADSRVCCYDAKTLTQVYRGKPVDSFKGTKITGACAALSGLTADPDSAPVVLSTNGPVVYGFSPLTGTARLLVNMEAHLPTRTDKKAAKSYAIAGHPLCPHVVGVATNGGIAIVRGKADTAAGVTGLPESVSFKPPATAVAPGGDLIQADEAPDEVAAMHGASTVTLVGDKLIGQTFIAHVAASSDGADTVLPPSGTVRAAVNVTPLPVIQTSRHVIATLKPGSSSASLHASADGTMVAVCWADDSRYQVFGRMSAGGDATAWRPVDEGVGAVVAWHHTDTTLAVLVRPKAKDRLPASIDKKAYKNMGPREILAIQESFAANEAALMAKAATVTVRALSMTEPPRVLADAIKSPDIASASDSLVCGLHGGLLLGISFQNVVSGPNKKRWLMLHDWSGSKTGIKVADPLWVSYSPACEYAALAYEDGLDIIRLGSTFDRLTRVGVRHPVSAVWNDTQLYVSTDRAVYVVFMLPPAEAGNQLCQRTNLFAQTGGEGLPELSGLSSAAITEVSVLQVATVKASNGRDLRTAATKTDLPALSIRPGSNARLVVATDDVVWLCTSHGHPCALPLAHAGVKTRQVAASGDLVAARKLAQQALPPRSHNDLAVFFSAFGLEGVSEALLLPGLSLELELALAIKCGALKRGVACLGALLSGCEDRTLLGRFAAWNARDIDPDAVTAAVLESSADYNVHDPFAVLDAPIAEAIQRTQVAANVMTVFKDAAGVHAPTILMKLPVMGVQGRATAIDADFFTSAPEGDDPEHVARTKAPPPAPIHKAMFPAAAPKAPPPLGGDAGAGATADGGAAPALVDAYQDVIDWDWPLRAMDTAAAASSSDAAVEGGAAADADAKKGGAAAATANGSASEKGGAAAEKSGAAAQGGAGEGEGGKEVAEKAANSVAAHVVATPRSLELGIQLMDASVSYADVEILQQTIKLMAPHTSAMTAAQQQRLVAAVGASGLASQLADLTLSGTTPLQPSPALLAGFLSGDARVTARVLEKEGLLPLFALFSQSCGAGGAEASMAWESELQGMLGGSSRMLVITPNLA